MPKGLNEESLSSSARLYIDLMDCCLIENIGVTA